jgi:hypothetical protein
MWNVVSQVGSGFALTAFVAAAVLTAYRAKLSNEVARLKTLSKEDRIVALTDVLDAFKIDTANLTNEQKYSLALKQISIRQAKLFAQPGVRLLILSPLLIACAQAGILLFLTFTKWLIAGYNQTGESKGRYILIGTALFMLSKAIVFF